MSINRILFAGDTIFSGIVPAIGNRDVRELESTLRVLMEMEIEVLILGHGEILYGARNVQEWLSWEVDYLARAQDFIRKQLDQGTDPEAVIALVGYKEFIGEHISIDKHGMLNRHRGTVSRVFGEGLGTSWSKFGYEVPKIQIFRENVRKHLPLPSDKHPAGANMEGNI